MQVLREYLYVDLEKVNGFASQLYDGLPEANEESSKNTHRGQMGSRAVAFIGKDKESNIMERRLLADAMFPRIEDHLESEGYLEDISDVVEDPTAFESGKIRSEFPAGTIVRITAAGRIIDPRYFGRTMAGIATAITGLDLLASSGKNLGMKGKGAGRQQQPKRPAPNKPDQSQNLEDLIPDIGANSVAAQLGLSNAGELRGMVKIMRGLYPEGVSMLLSPAGIEGPGISLRLQEGRQYLDAEPDVLFARYGLGVQEWTVIGTIGYHAEKTTESNMENIFDGGKLRRGVMTAGINEFLSSMGNIGFSEVAQEPGFSMVPIAVYRVIPKSARALLPAEGEV
ncbi:hypothetical protein ABZV91_17560 [Nocardia sp. NPDC004568]|uniref:DUF6414 family protein n=1 Tax=Nocardia sp. NPDC004568 TaxID=3154551 RepID=UPI0033B18A8D